jgi:hypothetical protein
MEFFICRTSGSCFNKKKPTENAYKKGEHWYIKINSLEELIDLTKIEGEIIISKDTLEIYDDYRE